MKNLLNVGCGHSNISQIRGFDSEIWNEIRLDIDSNVKPDLQTICDLIAQDKLLEPLYESPIGPIFPIDILFGNRQQIMKGNVYMAKKVGFTYSVLNKTFAEAGFQARYGGRMPSNGGELAIVAFKQKKSEEQIKQIADPLIF